MVQDSVVNNAKHWMKAFFVDEAKCVVCWESES